MPNRLNNKKNSKFLKLAVLPILLITVIYILQTDLFLIKDFSIKAENIFCANQETIIDYLKQLKISLFDQGNLENKLKQKFLCIDYANSQLELPNKLKMDIFGKKAFGKLNLKQESSPSAYFNWWQTATDSAQPKNDSQEVGTVIIDEQGDVFSDQKDLYSASSIEVINKSIKLGQKVDHELINAIKIINQLTSQKLEIIWAKVFNESLFIKTSYRLIFDLSKDPNYDLASLQLILQEAKINSKPIESIDLRFNKPVVVYSPK